MFFLAGSFCIESDARSAIGLDGEQFMVEANRCHPNRPDREGEHTEQERLSAVHSAVLRLIGQGQVTTSQVERREKQRVGFVQSVRVITDDNRAFTMFSRDLSTTGIRLIGTQRLLGRKVHAVLSPTGGGVIDFLVRILWTCPMSDGLVENGGTFLSVARGSIPPAESGSSPDSSAAP
jgi:hypothetical protein